MEIKCELCNTIIDGSLMRHRSKKIEDLLYSDDVPRIAGRNGIKLCHLHQRSVYFANGYTNLLLKIIKKLSHQCIIAGVK